MNRWKFFLANNQNQNTLLLLFYVILFLLPAVLLAVNFKLEAQQ